MPVGGLVPAPVDALAWQRPRRVENLDHELSQALTVSIPLCLGIGSTAACSRPRVHRCTFCARRQQGQQRSRRSSGKAGIVRRRAHGSHARAGSAGRLRNERPANWPRATCHKRAVDRETGCAVRLRGHATASRRNAVDTLTWIESPQPRSYVERISSNVLRGKGFAVRLHITPHSS